MDRSKNWRLTVRAPQGANDHKRRSRAMRGVAVGTVRAYETGGADQAVKDSQESSARSASQRTKESHAR